jgi:hypothetical protein
MPDLAMSGYISIVDKKSGMKNTLYLCSALFFFGCSGNSQSDSSTNSTDLGVSSREIKKCRSQLLDSLHLSADRHTPWELVHAMLAWGPDCPVRCRGDETVRSLADYFFCRPIFLGSSFYESDRAGTRIRAERRNNNISEYHPNEFLAVFALNGLQADRRVEIDVDRSITIRDLIDTAKREYYLGRLPSFLLIVICTYESLDSTWENSRGSTISASHLLEVQMNLARTDQPCGGSHGYLALAVARNRLKSTVHSNGRLSRIDEHIEKQLRTEWERCVQYQEGDGSFSPQAFGPVYSDNSTQRIYVTGHILEWVLESGCPDIVGSNECERCAQFLVRSLFKPDVVNRASLGELGHAARALDRFGVLRGNDRD